MVVQDNHIYFYILFILYFFYILYYCYIVLAPTSKGKIPYIYLLGTLLAGGNIRGCADLCTLLIPMIVFMSNAGSHSITWIQSLQHVAVNGNHVQNILFLFFIPDFVCTVRRVFHDHGWLQLLKYK